VLRHKKCLKLRRKVARNVTLVRESKFGRRMMDGFRPNGTGLALGEDRYGCMV